jgi:hypothetical protein
MFCFRIVGRIISSNFLTTPIGGPGFLISILSAAGLIDAVTDLSDTRTVCFN